MTTISAPLLLLLLLLLLPPPAPADLSPQYHNYFDTTTICGMSPLNRRVNNELIPFSRAAPYVINGNDAYYGEWPFAVRIIFNYTSECSGVIVSSEVVVTAGHCIRKLQLGSWDSGYKTELGPEVYAYVEVGRITIGFEISDEHRGAYTVKAVQEGAYYKDRGFRQFNPDFARLWLSKPIEWNDYVQPVCIPSDPETIYRLARGSQPLYFIGYGVNLEKPERTYPSVQQWFQEKSSDPDYDDRTYGRGDEPDNYMIFVPHDNTYRMICKGDSGGPLVALDKNKRWSLVGIAIRSPPDCTPRSQIVQDFFLLMAKIVGIFDKNFQPPAHGDATAGGARVRD